jgi:ribosome-binding protein aMBF1 (putative translation factor)
MKYDQIERTYGGMTQYELARQIERRETMIKRLEKENSGLRKLVAAKRKREELLAS